MKFLYGCQAAGGEIFSRDPDLYSIVLFLSVWIFCGYYRKIVPFLVITS